MELIECNNKKNEVVQHNDLIRAQGVLSNNSKKMLAMLISMIKSTDSEFQEYALHIDSYEEAIGRKSNDVEAIKNNALELMKNPFELKKGVFFNWCNKVDISSIDGYVIFKIDNELKPYLLQLQNNFTKYKLFNVLKLKSTYSISLYEYFTMRYKTYKNEYFKEHNKYPNSYKFEIKIDWLRSTYRIPESYLYTDIKRQIINKTREDFKKYTDIKFDYKEQKFGKKIDRLIVTVSDNDKTDIFEAHKKKIAKRQKFIDIAKKKKAEKLSNVDDYTEHQNQAKLPFGD